MTEAVKVALYTRHDAARVLKRSVSTIIRLERAGELEPIKLRGAKSATLYRVEQVDALAKPQAHIACKKFPSSKPRIQRRMLDPAKAKARA